MHTPEGHPILGEHHEYVTIWGYWNKTDEELATRDEDHYRPIDALEAGTCFLASYQGGSSHSKNKLPGTT